MNLTSKISQLYSRLKILPEHRVVNKTVAIIVAHPDDETLWAGGTIMSHPSWKCFVVCLCRGNDLEKSQRFFKALKILKSEGIMGDLNDGPEQKPLDENEIERLIISLIPPWHFDLIITHSQNGEFTRDLRHEEIGNVVLNLWYVGRLSASELWTFAYEDGNMEYYPRPIKNAAIQQQLSRWTWFRKYRIITETYGLRTKSFEAKTTPKAESFWQLTNASVVYPFVSQNYAGMKS
jgi:LmbE family N-acetylglucosaminyl deacetylase